MSTKKLAAFLLLFVLVHPCFAQAQQAGLTHQQQLQMQEATRIEGQALEVAGTGNFREAVNPLKKVLEIHRQVLGDQHPTTVLDYQHLGFFLNRGGQFEEAESYYLKALEFGLQAQGEKNDVTLKTREELAANYLQLKQYEKATLHTDRLLSIAEQMFGSNHQKTIEALRRSMFTALMAKQYDVASAFGKRFLSAKENLTGVNSAGYCNGLNQLGQIFLKTDNDAKAKEHYSRSLTILKQITSENDIQRREPHMWLSTLARRAGDFDTEVSHLRRAHELTAKNKGEIHEESCSFLFSLAKAIDLAGDEDRGIKMMKSAIAL